MPAKPTFDRWERTLMLETLQMAYIHLKTMAVQPVGGTPVLTERTGSGLSPADQRELGRRLADFYNSSERTQFHHLNHSKLKDNPACPTPPSPARRKPSTRRPGKSFHYGHAKAVTTGSASS